MGLSNLLIMLVYGVLVILLVFIYSKIREYDRITRTRMVGAVSLKILGAMVYLLIYDFYFGYGGDSKAYFHDAILLNDLFISSPIEYFKFAFGSVELNELWYSDNVRQMYFEKGTREFSVDVITSMFTWLGLKNYYASTMLVAFASFIGFWNLYRVFEIRYPNLSSWAFLATFCIPSCMIWASAIVKENYIMMTMAFVFLNVYYIGVRKDKVILRILIIALLLYVISFIKLYVLMALIPALICQVFLSLLRNSERPVVRKVLRPLLLVSVISLTFFLANNLVKQVEMFSFDSFLGKAKSMQDWHYKEGANTSEQHGRGSSYTLGTYNSSVLGTLIMLPSSINVTFFRPYPWEIRNPIMAFVSLESFAFLLFFVYILGHRNLYKYRSKIFHDPFLIMMLVFCAIFGFLVGFTSYNFGALDRYKLPAMPVFLFALAIIHSHLKSLKKIGAF